MDNLFFTNEHIMIRNMVREFADSEITPVAQELDELGKFPRDLVDKMGELGLMGILIPEKYGGAGLDMVAFATAIMELGRADASVAITMTAHSSLGSLPILMFGSEEQKNTYLPKLASGEMLGAFGLTEPAAGSDAGATKTKAVRDGDEYVVNGGKIFITNVGEAGVLSFTSQVVENGENLGIAAFTIPTNTEGLEIGPKEKKMGWRASDTRQLFFKDMRIPASSILGTPGEGFKTFMKTLTSGRVSIGALSVGTAVGAYERALAYSKEREAFGKSIHKFQSVGFKLANMATKIEASKLLVYHAAWMKDQGLDITKEAAMAKLFASETAMEVTTEAIQVLGGYGYVRDYGVERFFRDAKILEIGEGTSEIQRLIISREIIKDVQV
ncbi:MAG: acyl-CoA dehydrogenase [Candidatus Marinimicrobia bacterium]|jgi:alkylation response protein AidB-like acyl-CoA dehydrogenase|nr:acyl-CoA dehydrogenase [Candidatus Neomarinimicrobiota bacterium]MBT4154350.1 acyl-CoA dehydrogenase [Candidatus Neomarinimicrobiota bacterium]MBT5114918.1 acyl-CoA dehydrogenase [Candidatus Neomarinimicrobiota bacterium]MBT5749077.1 acyl-CoA dehydrogenase [Candidatus Neomarinimicrobiota bacterium]MBT6796547.1 acyl-CoA dehydrogenase [Candidatus Neomarinimicrobiota bacterium]|tara:strand:- start:4649 stop:5803 length:1155 start_codon:yes stop_codon:yes gene_type:complete